MKTVSYRRKREGKTDYKTRLKILLSGKPRLVVRKSLKNIVVQLVNHEIPGDKVLVTVRASELKELGWKFNLTNLPGCYLTGYLAGKKILEKGYKEAIFDIGLQGRGRRLFAVLKGAIDAGLEIPHDASILPDDASIKGKHISDYAGKGAKFTGYQKAGADPKGITQSFETVKGKLG